MYLDQQVHPRSEPPISYPSYRNAPTPLQETRTTDASFERLLVGFDRDVGIHHGCHIVDLLFLSLLQKFPVTVGILQGNCITHGERHQRLVEYEIPILREFLQLTKWHR